MIKRRERIERWRTERKLKELENNKKDIKAISIPSAKKWSLEDDSEDEEDTKEKVKIEKIKSDSEGEKEVEEDIDPLDAFMQEVDKEVRKVNKISKPTGAQNVSQSSDVMIVTGVSKKSSDKKKGDLMEQNQDGLEYSSEEEIEDIKDTAANLANKHKKELAKIDHSGVDYAPFRKNFYVEVPELGKMTSQDVEQYKEKLEGIQVKGKGCPKPIKV